MQPWLAFSLNGKWLYLMDRKDKKNEYSVWHKRILKLFFYIGVGGFIPIAVFRSFIPYPWYFNLANKFSIFLALVTVLYIVFLLQKEIIYPASKWYTSSIFKRLLVAAVFPFIIYFIYFANLVDLYPLLYTDEFGEKVKKTVFMVKHKRYSNGRFAKWSCDYYLRPHNSKNYFFQFCISKNRYLNLPEQKFKVNLEVKQSSSGYVVKSVQFL